MDASGCEQHNQYVGADGSEENNEVATQNDKGGISQSTLNTMLIGSLLVLVLASAIKKM